MSDYYGPGGEDGFLTSTFCLGDFCLFVTFEPPDSTDFYDGPGGPAPPGLPPEIWTPPEDEPPPPPTPTDPPVFDIVPFTLFVVAEYEGEVIAAGYPYLLTVTGEPRFRYCIKNTSAGAQFTISDYGTDYSVTLNGNLAGRFCALLSWTLTGMSVQVWGGGVLGQLVTGLHSGSVHFEPDKIISYYGAVEELEKISVAQTEDYWDTYPQFYLIDGMVEVTNVKCEISSENLSCRHDLVSSEIVIELITIGVQDAYHVVTSTQIGLSTQHVIASHDSVHVLVSDKTGVTIHPDVLDASHSHYGDQVALSDEWLMAPHGSGHVLVSDEVGVTVHTAPYDCGHVLISPEVTILAMVSNDSSHSHYTDQVALSDEGLISPHDNEHVLVSDEVGVTVHPKVAGAYHESFSSGWQDISLISKMEVVVEDSTNYHDVDGGLILGLNGNTVYPHDSLISVEDTGVSQPTMRQVIYTVRNCVHHLLSDELPAMPQVFHIVVASCSHILRSDVVTPTYIRPFNSAHSLTSDMVWNWVERAYHEGLSQEVWVQVTIDPLGSYISFAPEADIVLGLSITAHDCYHSLFTRDEMIPEDCHHFLFSDEVRGNEYYRRISD